ncbi:hypothetical protein Avbf_14394 [Armadillidium vulgare]|nr:hypothetical protein Avbf_14394 [Armadillidium vulgare]
MVNRSSICGPGGVSKSYFSYYGYEIALQLAISTCIAIALCLLVASIYNAVGFRRPTAHARLETILRSENGVRESPPDDIPPKYDDVVEDLPSYQDAIKMFESSPRNETVGIVNEAFEDDVNSSQEEVRKEDPPPAYNINPGINRKKRYKSHYQEVDCNGNNESNKNHTPSENVLNNFDKELKTTNQNIRSTPPENNLTESLSLRSENGNESQYLALRNEEPTHNEHAVAEINNTNNETENSTDEQEDSK